MPESITVTFSLHAAAKDIYNAWLDSDEHTAMTGEKATASREVGGEFTAWNGYISGKNLLLIPGKKIVQSWRSSEFPDDAPDSVLSIQLIENQGITEIDLEHKDIPPGQGLQYRAGWIDYYANPMQKYFAARGKSSVAQNTARKVAPNRKSGGAKQAKRAVRPVKKQGAKKSKGTAAPKKAAAPKKKVAATKATRPKSGKRR
jgi:hypothetical protein